MVELTVPNVPGDPTLGQRTVSFGRELYIDRADFKEVCNAFNCSNIVKNSRIWISISYSQEADDSYWRLTTSQSVGLNHASCIISVKDILKVLLLPKTPLLYQLLWFRILRGKCASCMWSVGCLRKGKYPGKTVLGHSSIGWPIPSLVPSEYLRNCEFFYPGLLLLLFLLLILETLISPCLSVVLVFKSCL